MDLRGVRLPRPAQLRRERRFFRHVKISAIPPNLRALMKNFLEPWRTLAQVVAQKNNKTGGSSSTSSLISFSPWHACLRCGGRPGIPVLGARVLAFFPVLPRLIACLSLPTRDSSAPPVFYPQGGNHLDSPRPASLFGWNAHQTGIKW
jgi:hypothetical protein